MKSFFFHARRSGVRFIFSIAASCSVLASLAAASPIGAGLVYTAATLIACRLTSIEMSGQAGQGGKALTVPIDLKPMKIYPAGVGGAQGVDGNPFPLVSPGQG